MRTSSRRPLLQLLAFLMLSLTGPMGIVMTAWSAEGTNTPAPQEPAKCLTNAIGMELVRIPSGKFIMGSPPAEPTRYVDEDQHAVVITRAFYLGVYEVTQEQYQRLTSKNPSFFSQTGRGSDQVRNLKTQRFPVERVSWSEAEAYCRLLSEQHVEKRAGRVYRLPTEAEWEYACRAGTRKLFSDKNSLTSRDANFDGKYPMPNTRDAQRIFLDRPTQVGSYAANGFGLYDMHGNVAEWCADAYDQDYYHTGPGKDPLCKLLEQSDRVVRGGSFRVSAAGCRAAFRVRISPESRSNCVGFRVACNVTKTISDVEN